MGKKSKAAPPYTSTIEHSLERQWKPSSDEPRFKPELSIHNENGNSWGTREGKLRSLFSDETARMAFITLGELQPLPEFIAVSLAYELQLDEGAFMGALRELRGANLAWSKTLTIECDHGENSAQSLEIWFLTGEGQAYLGRMPRLIDNDFAKERADVVNSFKKLEKSMHVDCLEQFEKGSMIKRENEGQLLLYDLKVLILLMKRGEQLFQLTQSLLSQIKEMAGKEKKDAIESMVKLVNLGFLGFSKINAMSLTSGGNVQTIMFRCLPYCANRIAALARSQNAREALALDGVVLDESMAETFIKSARIAEASAQPNIKIRQGSLDGLASGGMEAATDPAPAARR